MDVTELELQLCFEGGKLRGFTCKLMRSAYGFLPESSCSIAGQVLLPYLLAGQGMVAAGMIMDTVQVRQFCSVPVGRCIYVHVGCVSAYRSVSYL